MIEADHRGLHWHSTKTNALIAIGILVGLFLIASLFVDLFSDWNFLGFPLGFYYAAQGAFILMIVLVYWSTGRQEKTDRQYGASEEI